MLVSEYLFFHHSIRYVSLQENSVNLEKYVPVNVCDKLAKLEYFTVFGDEGKRLILSHLNASNVEIVFFFFPPVKCTIWQQWTTNNTKFTLYSRHHNETSP